MSRIRCIDRLRRDHPIRSSDTIHFDFIPSPTDPPPIYFFY
jgi:hypothetical protein